MEVKSYFSATPDSGDQARTEEIKRYSRESQSGPSDENDKRQAVMNMASKEIDRRVKKYMLSSNDGYSEIAKKVLQEDPELAELYAKGYARE